MKDKKLIKNSLQCADCHDIIVSEFGHDFKYCKCGKIYIDGGLDCPRGGWTDKLPIKLFEYEE